VHVYEVTSSSTNAPSPILGPQSEALWPGVLGLALVAVALLLLACWFCIKFEVVLSRRLLWLTPSVVLVASVSSPRATDPNAVTETAS